MIERVNEDKKELVFNTIGDQFGKCLYLYLDLKKYGFDNPNISIWISKNNNNDIDAIVLKYYSGMHVFSPNGEVDIEDIRDLVEKERPTLICAERSIIEKLERSGGFEIFDSEYGWVRCLDSIEQGDESGIIKEPSEEEFRQLTELLLSDPDIGGSYTFDSMYNQIIERYQDGYGRDYILKDGDRVIAHAGTGAEDDKLGILNYAITDPDYRKRGIAMKLCTSVCHDLTKEGRKVFLINYSDASTALYDKLGFKVYCEWGKLFINNEG
ncbi:GNAT family N-acetyltransferase [Candidatus Saccharibacteria bacterium]|nr:GNAT family N-acetyltransferase [Candidatus Saccharibacteria bacterium]